jgi:hypothetical protein
VIFILPNTGEIMRKSLSTICLVFVLLLTGSTLAANKVVVVPLGGAVGNATIEDVVKGKIFSNSTEKGLTGTLKLNPKPTGDAVAADVLEGKTFSNKDGVGIVGTLHITYCNSISYCSGTNGLCVFDTQGCAGHWGYASWDEMVGLCNNDNDKVACFDYGICNERRRVCQNDIPVM